MEDNSTKTNLAYELLITSLKMDQEAQDGDPPRLEQIIGTQNCSLVIDRLKRLAMNHLSHKSMIYGIIEKYEKKRTPIYAEATVIVDKKRPVFDKDGTFSKVVGDHIIGAMEISNIHAGSVLDVDINEAIANIPLNEYLINYFKSIGYDSLPVRNQVFKTYHFQKLEIMPDAFNAQETLEAIITYQFDCSKKKRLNQLEILKKATPIMKYHISRHPFRLESYFNLAILYQRLYRVAQREGYQATAIDYLNESMKMLEHTHDRIELSRRLEHNDAIGLDISHQIYNARAFFYNHMKLFEGFILMRYFYAFWFLFFDENVPFYGKGSQTAYNAKNEKDFLERVSELEKSQVLLITQRARNKKQLKQYHNRLSILRKRLNQISEQKAYFQSIQELHIDELRTNIEQEILNTMNVNEETKVPFSYLEIQAVEKVVEPQKQNGFDIFQSIIIEEIKKGFGIVMFNKRSDIIVRFSKSNYAVLTAIRIHENLLKVRRSDSLFTLNAIIIIHTGIINWATADEQDNPSRESYPTSLISKSSVSAGKIVITRPTLDDLDYKLRTRFIDFLPDDKSYEEIINAEAHTDTETPVTTTMELFEYNIQFD